MISRQFVHDCLWLERTTRLYPVTLSFMNSQNPWGVKPYKKILGGQSPPKLYAYETKLI